MSETSRAGLLSAARSCGRPTLAPNRLAEQTRGRSRRETRSQNERCMTVAPFLPVIVPAAIVQEVETILQANSKTVPPRQEVEKTIQGRASSESQPPGRFRGAGVDAG